MTFEEIYNAYSERILNLVYRMTSKEEVARDLTQDIFIKVYHNLETFKQESQVYTWIHRIAVNHVLNYLKHEKRAKWFSLLPEGPINEIPHKTIDREYLEQTTSPQADKSMEQEERASFIRGALQSLSPKYQIPLILYHYEGISYKEIAEIMDLNISAVESRIHRAKKQLIKKLEPLLDHI